VTHYGTRGARLLGPTEAKKKVQSGGRSSLTLEGKKRETVLNETNS